jgi:hypothetical protein
MSHWMHAGKMSDILFDNITIWSSNGGMKIQARGGGTLPGEISNVTWCEKTPLFAPFAYKNDHFAKTGSGQTWGKLKKDAVFSGQTSSSRHR